MKSETLIICTTLCFSPLTAQEANHSETYEIQLPDRESETQQANELLANLEKNSEDALNTRAALKRQYADDQTLLIEKLRGNDRKQIEILGDRIAILTRLIIWKDEAIEAYQSLPNSSSDQIKSQLRQLIQEKLSLLDRQRALFLRYEDVITHKDEVPQYPQAPIEERLAAEIAILRNELEAHIEATKLQLEKLQS